MGKLTAVAVRALNQPGMHSDGQGLYLQVQAAGQRSWIHRYTRQGRTRDMGLGAFPLISLAEARQRRDANRVLLVQDVDPLDAKRAAATPAEAPAGLTFRDAAERYIADQMAGWRNPKHGQQWRNTLATYAHPIIGDMACCEVSVRDVEAVLRPIWQSKPETAQRVRGRIEAVISAAHAREGWAAYRNPATWRDNLARIFPSRRRVAPVRHFAALPWRDAPAFMARLRVTSGVGALALEFTILTAARSLMARGATWGEVDGFARVWVVPGTRVLAAAAEDRRPDQVGSGLKGLEEHRIPLSDAALHVLDVLRALRRSDQGDFLFPGIRPHQHISNATMAAVLKRLGIDVTVHGFRSTFRDWAAEATHHHPDIAEIALAHALPGGGVRAAYQRGKLFEKRHALMADWAAYLAGASESVGAAPVR